MAISVARGSTFDSRVFAPYIKSAIPNQSTQSGTVAAAINCAFYIAGGTNPIWSAVSLPSGISINAATGLITGTISGATANPTITCTNSVGSVQSSFAWTVIGQSLFSPLPTQAEEQATYDSWGWAWTSADKATTFSATPGAPGPSAQGYDYVHNDSEGDDLWAHYQAYLRTGNIINKNWAQAWRNYYVNGYIADISGGTSSERDQFLNDHLYGQGLILWHHYENDPTALAAAQTILGIVEAGHLARALGSEMSHWGCRAYARHLIVATYVAEKTQLSRWITLRDKLINLWLQASDYQDTSNSSIAAGGMYFFSRDQAAVTGDGGGAAFYDSGRRCQYTFQIANLFEGFWRVYLVTGRIDVRDRIIQMAKALLLYSHRPTHSYPHSDKIFGWELTGLDYHRNVDGTVNAGGCDPSYDVSCVNGLVMGYKLTGEVGFLQKAKHHWSRSSHFTPNPGFARLAPDTDVEHYTDTRATSEGRFNWNKGELQFNYLLFENGGNPSVVRNTIPSYLTGLTNFQARTLIGNYGPSVASRVSIVARLNSDPNYAPWTTNDLNEGIGGMCSYSGGTGDIDDRLVIGHGWGHHAGGNNGAYPYDFNDDGNGRPIGYDVKGLSYFADRPPDAPEAIWNVYTNGGLASVHTESSTFYDPVSKIMHRTGHAGFSSGGGGPGACRLLMNVPLQRNLASAWQLEPGLTLNISGDTPLALFDRRTRKGFYTQRMGFGNNNGGAQFFRGATNTWGNEVGLGTYGAYNGNGGYGSMAYDFLRGRIIVIQGGNYYVGFNVDFNSETASGFNYTPIGDIGGLQGGAGVFFDPLRHFRGDPTKPPGVFWIYGQARTFSNHNELTEMCAATFECKLYPMSGDAAHFNTVAGGTLAYNYWGNLNRGLCEYNWRILFVIDNTDSGPRAIKLPGPFEIT